MDFNTYTTKAAGAVEGALGIVRSHGQQSIEPVHLLAALLSGESGIVLPLLKKLGKETSTLISAVEREISTLPKVSGGTEPYVSNALRSIFTRASAHCLKNHRLQNSSMYPGRMRRKNCRHFAAVSM